MMLARSPEDAQALCEQSRLYEGPGRLYNWAIATEGLQVEIQGVPHRDEVPRQEGHSGRVRSDRLRGLVVASYRLG